MSKRFEITWDQFVEKYKPIQNEMTELSPFWGTMFETFGDEVKKVWEAPVLNVWTLFDSDEITSGRWRINRLGYFITEVARKENETIDVIDL